MPSATGSASRCSRRSTRSAPSAWRRAAILCALLLSGCCPALGASDSLARTLRLREAPVPVACERGTQMAECVMMLREDWTALVTDYKALCLRLGGTPEACQTP